MIDLGSNFIDEVNASLLPLLQLKEYETRILLQDVKIDLRPGDDTVYLKLEVKSESETEELRTLAEIMGTPKDRVALNVKRQIVNCLLDHIDSIEEERNDNREPCPECGSRTRSGPGGGIECTKCGWWECW